MGAVVDLDSRRSVLGRTFDLLECFSAEEPELNIGVLCSRTGLPAATVHRMLAHLGEWGAIERTGRGRYRLGMRLWRLGWGVPDARVLKDVARPHLVDLHIDSQQVAMLVSRDGDRMVVADSIAGLSAASRTPLPRHLPLCDSAPGMAFVAHLDVDEQAEVLGRAGAELDFAMRQRFTEMRRLRVVTARRRAQDSGELTWLAAPVLDELGRVRSTVCLAGEMDAATAAALVPLVRDAAARTSSALAHATRADDE